MIITRYLLRNLVMTALFVTLALTAVVWLSQALKMLELVANSDAPAGMFLQLALLTLPKFLEVVIPVSLVMAVVFLYNKFVMENELVVLRAAGFHQFALARPALVIAVAATVLLLALSTYISPKSFAQLQSMRQTIKAEYSSFLLKEGVFNSFGKNLTVYLRARGEGGELEGLLIHDTRDKKKPAVTITAKRGQIVMEGDIPNLIVHDGLRQQMDTESGVISRLYFSSYTIEIKGFDNGSTERWREASERTFMQLLTPNLSDKRDAAFRKVFLAEAHYRLTAPFNALGFTCVALACLLLGPFNRRGQSSKILMATVLVVLLQALDMALANMAKNRPEAVVGLYLVAVLPVATGLYLLSAHGEQVIMKWMRRRQSAATEVGV